MGDEHSYPGERATTDGRLRFDTGAAWLDLLATVGGAVGPTPRERLTDLTRLGAWLRAERLTPTSAPTEADLLAARRLRETLRLLARAVLQRRPPDPAEVGALNEFLAADQPLSVGIHGAHPALAAPTTTRHALARVARQAAEHLTGPAAAHLRACAEPACSMIFLDPTGRRRWCAANRCGVRSRVRAHRARQS